MLIERRDLLDLLGPRAALAPGGALDFALPGSGRRAHLSWGPGGEFAATVSEDLGGDASLVVSVAGVYDAEEDAFDARGLDGTGESGDPEDPRTAAMAWRRLVAPMELITR